MSDQPTPQGKGMRPVLPKVAHSYPGDHGLIVEFEGEPSNCPAPLRRYTRSCLFCKGPATVLAPRGSSPLDVEAEFSSAGRAFGYDGDTHGVACYRCARKRWAIEKVLRGVEKVLEKALENA